MRVAGHHVHEPARDQVEQRVRPRTLLQQRGGHLHERAAPRRVGQALRQVLDQVALGVGHEAREAARRERVDRLPQRVRQRARARLEQDPAPAAAERDPAQVLVAQRRRTGLGDLAAGQDAHGEPRGGDRVAQPQHALGQLADAHVVVVTDVRRGADRGDAVARGLARHCEAVGDVQRAVVEPREDVAVQVDHERPARILPAAAAGACPRRHP